MRRAASSERSRASSRLSPDREHRAGAVGAAAERAEDMARLAVDAHVLDAFDRTRLVRALDLLEHAFRRDEEADDRAADLGRRLEGG